MSIQVGVKVSKERASYYLEGIVVLINALVLTGWQFDIEFLKRPLSRLAMHPVTNLCFIASALAYMLMVFFRESIILRVLACVVAVMPLGVGILVFIEFLFKIQSGINAFMYEHAIQRDPPFSSSGIPVQTGFSFMLIGLALVLMSTRNQRATKISNYFAFITVFVGLFSVIGYLYRIEDLYGMFKYIPMSLFSGICFILMALSILLKNQHTGFMRAWSSRYAGGILARILIPSIVLVPVLLGYLRLQVSWRYAMSIEFGVALLVTSIIIIFFILVSYTSVLLNRSDALRQEAEARIIKLNEELEKKVIAGSAEIADYKHALDESSIVAITDQKAIIKYVNDNFCKISGYSRNELIGSDFRMLRSGRHSEEFIRNAWKTLESGKIWKGEIESKAKDGTFYWVDSTTVPFLNELGKPYQFIIIQADITERKRSQLVEKELEEEVKAKKAELADIFDRITDGFIVLDNNFCYRYVNKKIGEMTGRDPRTLIGKNVWEEFPEAVGSDTYHAFIKAMKEQCHICHLDYFEPFDLWQENHIYPSAEGISVFIRDVSEQKKAEERNIKLNEELLSLNTELEKRVVERTAQLASVNKELEAFSYSISHDLRAPLRAVNGYAKMVEEDYESLLDENGKRLLNTIQDNARQMGILIDDLLAFSRLGRKEIQKSVADMDALVHRVVLELDESMKHRAEIRIGTIHPAPADGALIKQVMINFISNAIKYSSKSEHPVIEINSYKTGDEVVYSIKDNGTGFDMQYKDKLFGVFHRLHAQSEFEGTGVGLAIVKRIIDKHQGNVWAEAEVGKGATFYFSLPVHSGKAFIKPNIPES